MSRRATVTETELKRALKVATSCGLIISELEMTTDKVRIKFGTIDEPELQDETVGPLAWPEQED